jgi:formate C-acetyltransferase
MAVAPYTIPPRFPKSLRAVALVADIESGARGDWRDGSGLQGRSVTYRAQAALECAGEPDPHLRGARIVARTLDLFPATIAPLHLFAANGIPPTASDAERGRAYETLRSQPWIQGHSHHISMHYERLLRLGVRGVLAEVAEREAALDACPERVAQPPSAVAPSSMELPDSNGFTAEGGCATSCGDERRTFYAAVRISLEAFQRHAGRYRAEALRLMDETPDPARRTELSRIADALAHVPAEPARTFFEAIQSMLLLHFASRTHDADSAAGRLDHYFGPYYEADLAAGRITRPEAAEWVQVLLAHLLELNRFSDAVTLGGCEDDGTTPFCNDLTFFVLDAMAHLRLPTPQIGLRYTPGHPRELLRRGVGCVRAGTGHPGFFYDPVAIAALERAEFTRAQAADYVNCNCVELSSAGRSSIVSGYRYLNLPKMLEMLLNDGRQMLEETKELWLGFTSPPPESLLPLRCKSFEDLLAAFGTYLDHAIDGIVDSTNAGMKTRSATNSLAPLSSAFIEGCIETGRHAMLGGAVCGQTFPTFIGLVNAANSLAAIRQLVFEEKSVTLAEIAEACRSNFEGHAALRERIVNDCPRYGNDDPRADDLLRHLYDRIARSLEGRRNSWGQAYAPQYFGWLAHAMRGRHTAATPDGRLAGEAVSGTLGGDGATDRRGPTALLRSATSFDHTQASGGLAVNLAVDAALLRDDAGAERLVDLTLAYFAMGGMQIQYNCVSPETLREAQAHPDRHRHLLVRVAGYSDRFVCLDAPTQDDIVRRTQHALA